MGVKLPDARLSCIAGLVSPCGLAADVGSDHGLLLAHLLESGRIQRGIATDIRPQPLEKTRALLSRRGLMDRADLYLTDGLSGVPPQGLDTVVIAGMGGETIFHIFSSWPHAQNKKITWLLQPMTKAPELRKSLYETGFAIRAESCCHTKNHSYTVITAAYAGAPQPCPGWQPYLGKLAPRNDRDRAYLAAYRARLLKLAQAKEQSSGPTDLTRDLRDAAERLAVML